MLKKVKKCWKIVEKCLKKCLKNMKKKLKKSWKNLEKSWKKCWNNHDTSYQLCLTFSSNARPTPYPLHHSALELNSSSTLRPSTTGLKKAGCQLCIQAIHSFSPIEHALGPLHLLWQVSFGCWVTWSISSWQSLVMWSKTYFSVSQQLRPERSAKWMLSILSDLPFTKKLRKTK